MTALVSNIIDALGYGVVYFPLALGVFLAFRMLRFLDLTVNGAFSLGAAVTAFLLIAGVATVSSVLGGLFGYWIG